MRLELVRPKLIAQLDSSTDSSRLTSASHSRNSSTGSTPPFVNCGDEEDGDEDNRRALLPQAART
jgi:hypothetical protein